MKDKIWHYLSNSMLVVTMNSYRAMRIIANYTLNALDKPLDMFLYGLHTNLAPFVTTFINAYDIWLAQLGNQISTTDSFYIALETLRSTDIKKWDIIIQGVFMRGTVGYKALLPKGRKPFQSGSQEDKVASVSALSLALTGISPLVGLKTLVDAKLLILNNSKTLKNTGKSTTGTDSDAVETAKKDLGNELYGTLGNLMFHFRTNPTAITPFFNVTAIRRLEQTIWNQVVKPLVTKYLFTRTLLATDSLRIVNNSLFKLRFSMVENKKDGTGTVSFEIDPLTSATVNRLDFGPLTYHNMVVENLGTGKAKFMVVII